MGWLKKISPISFVLASSAVLLLCQSVESTGYDCDLQQKFAPIAVTNGDSVAYLNVQNLNSPTITYQCEWNISISINHSFLDLSRVILANTDDLSIVGYHVDDDKKNTSITLYNSSVAGSTYPGLISVGGCTYVIVTLSLSKDVLTRTFTTVFYLNGDVLLSRESGLLAFPLNADQKSIINNNFTLRPHGVYSDRVVLLKFTQLPKIYSINVNNQTYSNNNPPTIFLQTSDPLSIEFKNYSISDGPIVTSYWLVSANCSGSFVLQKIGDQKPILYPNEAYRKEQQINGVKCAQLFSSPDKTKFQLLIDPNQNGLANSADTINFYDPTGTIELGLDNPSLAYYRTINNYLKGNNYVVLYDSPYAANTISTFIAPSLKVITNEEATVYSLTDKDLTVQVPAGTTTVVHMLNPTNLANPGHALVQFENITLSPGQMTITVFNSEDNFAEPLVTLGQFDRLPSVISSNTASMRVVFSGKIQALKVTYRLVAPEKSCQSLSTVAPTFEVKGGESGICSWYVPPRPKLRPTFNYTVINPTILTIPAGKALSVTTFGTKSTTDIYQGPIQEFYFPDMFWDNSNAYEFSIDASNPKDKLHLLFVEKQSYLDLTNELQSSDKTASIKSVNYPGYYPVGLDEYWIFNGTEKEWALVTINDIHLKAEHKLDLVSKEATQSWTGDVDLSGVEDYLVHYPFSINLNSKQFNLTSFSNRGVSVGIQYPGIANTLAVPLSGKSDISFSAVSNVSTNPLNIWRVIADDKSSKLWSDYILRINVSLADTLDKTKAKLGVYDSISLREQSIHLANGSINGTDGFFLGSIKSAFIVYDYSESIAAKTTGNISVSFTITAEKCEHLKNYTLSKCATTDRCITDMMICNGINECGDYSDELYCSGEHPQPPAPPAPAARGGVNTLVVIFVLMPLSAILSILGYIYLPQFMLRIRRGRYSEFRDLSEVS